jgi:ABC-type sugar transport system ATPase subunit
LHWTASTWTSRREKFMFWSGKTGREITKTFPGVVALDSIDLDIEEGEVHVLVGENGAGKSSLIKILCGIYYSCSGRGKRGRKIQPD